MNKETQPFKKLIATLLPVILIYNFFIYGTCRANPIPMTPEQQKELRLYWEKKLKSSNAPQPNNSNRSQRQNAEPNADKQQKVLNNARSFDPNLPSFLPPKLENISTIYNPSSIPNFSYQSIPNMAFAVGIDCLADFIVLFIGFAVIKKIGIIASWRFVPYFVLVVLGGLLIDSIGLLTINTSIGTILFGLLPLFLLFLYNWILSKVFFAIRAGRAIVIGILMAVLTNPLLGTAIAGADFPLWSAPEKARYECLMNMRVISSELRSYAENGQKKELPKSLKELSVKLYDEQYFKAEDFSFNLQSLNPLKFTVSAKRPSYFQLGPKIVTIDENGNWIQ